MTWARQAGRVAMVHFNQQIEPTLKADESLLTPADVEIEQFLIEQISSAYPNHYVVSEETPTSRPDQPSLACTWGIDPLDGTTAFFHGLPGWGISLGLLCAGQLIFGLFYMPLLNDLTCACAGELWWNEQQPAWTVKADWNHKGFLAVTTRAHQEFEIDVPRIRALGSVGASLVYTARGAATAALIPRAYLWDILAGAIILTQAGGELRYLSGQPVDYVALLDGRLTPEPILAGHPALLDELQNAIRPRQGG
jgi:myo-inositol-1(or 4)-monophosphatase